VAHCIDASVHGMQPAGSCTASNRTLAQPKGSKLSKGNHPVLSAGESSYREVRCGGLVPHTDTKPPQP
jgi:hypothetical protein